MRNIVNIVYKSYNPESPSRYYWDMGLIDDLLSNKLWKPVNGFEFEIKDNFDNIDGCILVIPARSNVNFMNNINKDISKLKWVIIMLTGDEENVFPVNKLKHNNIITYMMSPRENLDLSKYRVLGTGYPPQLHKILDSTKYIDKKYDWFFAGQVTHDRRKQAVEQLRNLSNGLLFETKGFTQGFSHEEYYRNMSESKISICPSGPETPDTFRLFESLELGCVPIADTRVSKGGFSDNYWTFFFNEEPKFPIIKDYESLPGYIEDQLLEYPVNSNNIYSWWQYKKRELSYQLVNDINLLRNSIYKNDDLNGLITVIIPISAIKSHPDTFIIDETIKSVRYHLPDSEIILMFDGIRPEHEEKRAKYNKFISKMLWKCNFEYKNILPVLFNEHQHQTGMTKKVLNIIKTPCKLFVEQDTPLVIDYEIPFVDLVKPILSGESNLIRLHHEGIIPKEHYHMIHGTEILNEQRYMKTSQWSQRPHLSSLAFYRRILSDYFSENAKSFIEDKMHSVVSEAYINDGLLGWSQFRLHIYFPKGNIKRSYHTDGRAGELKLDETQVF